MQQNRAFLVISVLTLLVVGHLLAVYVQPDKEKAWTIVTAFYATWLIGSLLLFLKKKDLVEMFRRSENAYWNLVLLPVIIAVIIFIFLPNLHLLKWDRWLLLNMIICGVNPFMEEIYWRGLVSRSFSKPLYAFLFSTLCFAASHPLLFGVSSPGVRGWTGFAGTFIVGALLWLCYFKTRSLRGAVLNHFLIDVAGMAVFILADKAVLAPI
jgi:membrane protease YdiL (CAAX protease family)